MRRVRRARLGVAHLLGVAVVGGDEEDVAGGLAGFVDGADGGVGVGDGGDGGVEVAGVADLCVGEVSV